MVAAVSPARTGICAFSPKAQKIIRNSREYANICKSTGIEPENLLASLAASKTGLGLALRIHGITPEEVLTYSTFHRQGQVPFALEFDEVDYERNFTKATRDILNTAIVTAEMRSDLTEGLIDKEVSEIDIFKSLTGLAILRDDSRPPLIFEDKGVKPHTVVSAALAP